MASTGRGDGTWMRSVYVKREASVQGRRTVNQSRRARDLSPPGRQAGPVLIPAPKASRQRRRWKIRGEYDTTRMDSRYITMTERSEAKREE